jgi:hypothetical protein
MSGPPPWLRRAVRTRRSMGMGSCGVRPGNARGGDNIFLNALLRGEAGYSGHNDKALHASIYPKAHAF